MAAISSGRSALARSCPELAENSVERDRLYAELLTTPNETLGGSVGNQLWEIWIRAPDDAAQDLLDQDRERVRVAGYEKAAECFT